ncbi:hypothetical protein CXB77_01635 [Chromatium okenii]|uniref:Uncharacterized protein n=1 Tax=Chromatium okenii TaxID=61644 RepID=A0A2S7XUQ5_9GAMM|nr:hypothetical protein CXB77_01635 [Chromatium okenii]
MGREVSSANIGHYGQHPPQARHQGEYADHILSFLNTNTDNSARVYLKPRSEESMMAVILLEYLH